MVDNRHLYPACEVNEELEEVLKRWREYCRAYRDFHKEIENPVVRVDALAEKSAACSAADKRLSVCDVRRVDHTNATFKGCIMLTMEGDDDC